MSRCEGAAAAQVVGKRDGPSWVLLRCFFRLSLCACVRTQRGRAAAAAGGAAAAVTCDHGRIFFEVKEAS
jgi:hypothetical protein